MVMGEQTLETQVVVIGAGPGGYAAAFRAADLGLEVTLVHNDERLGGVCLLRGCIPTKALLEATAPVQKLGEYKERGIHFGQPQIDLDALRGWKNSIVDKLSSGVQMLAKRRDIEVINGTAFFDSSNRLRIEGSEFRYIQFQQAIIATGSHPVELPDYPIRKGGRIMNSDGALELADIPKRLLVIGGGYIGMELGLVYANLGSKVTVVEMMDTLLPGMDPDLVKPLAKKADKLFEAVYLSTRVTGMEESADAVKVKFEGKADPAEQTFDRVLVSIGRKPNTANLGLENTAVQVDERGFIRVDEQRRTADPNIFAVGDVTGNPMLAHKAIHEGATAADVIAGRPSAFDAAAIPGVVYTVPEIATGGLTEKEAAALGYEVKTARFPWSASGRALTMGAADGFTKLVFDAKTQRLLGIGIVGEGAENLIAEGTLAIEMGATAEDLALTVHPHPTLSETIGEAADVFLGQPIHIFAPGKK
jgi:dihydrolipoamide dehydrogenase